MRGEIGAGPTSAGEEVQWGDRLLGPAFDGHEGGKQDGADDEGGQGDRVTPSVGGGPYESVDQTGHPDRRRHRSGHVEAAGCGFGLGQVARGQADEDDADRYIDEQGPPPGDPGGEHAPEHKPDTASGSGNSAVGADGTGALRALGKADLEQGEGGRRGDGGPDALTGPGSQQPLARLGQTAEQGRQREQGDPGDEDPTAAEDVPGTGAEEQQSAEGEGVGVLDPREPGRGEAQGAMDVRQGGDHHRGIEDDHQVGGEDDEEHHVRPPRRAGTRGRIGAASGQGGCHWACSLSWRVEEQLKWRHPPKVSGGCLRLLYGGNLRFATPHTQFSDDQH